MRSPVLLACLLLIACSDGDAQSPRRVAASPCQDQLFEGARFTVCDPKAGRLALFAAGPGEVPSRSFSDLARKVDPSSIAFAMNAGMFDESGHPVGLAVVDGLTKHRINLRSSSGNFGMKPNGVFAVTNGGAAEIVPSERLATSAQKLTIATQSGPMLVIRGQLHPAIQPDGESRLIRNGVGVTAAGKPLFVIADEPVSFGKFARLFRDELKTPNALYFDGSVSSLWNPSSGRQDSFADLGPIIVAFKPGASAPGRATPAKP